MRKPEEVIQNLRSLAPTIPVDKVAGIISASRSQIFPVDPMQSYVSGASELLMAARGGGKEDMRSHQLNFVGSMLQVRLGVDDPRTLAFVDSAIVVAASRPWTDRSFVHALDREFRSEEAYRQLMLPGLHR